VIHVPFNSQFFACVDAPDFPVQAVWRNGTPTCSGELPVAVLDGPDSLLKVFACNGPARKAGVEMGMTKIQAEVCPGIMLSRRVSAHEDAAQQALIDSGFKFSFRVESTAPGTIIIDLTGTERLLGPPQEIGKKIIDEYQGRFSVNVGVAANPDTALYAARGFPGLTVVAPGKEASCLGPLPIAILQASPEVLDTLDSWGVRHFKTLAALPPIALSERLGQYGLHLQRLCRGDVKRELVPAERPMCFAECVELEEAVELLEPLGFLLNRLLEQLCQRLTARSLATDEVRVDLNLEVHLDRELQADPMAITDRPLHQTRLKLPVPTQDAKVLLNLLQLDLAAHPPPAAVTKITIEVLPARVRTTQTGLFQPLAPEPAKLEITLARVRAVVGEKDEHGRGRVGFPIVTDSNRPESFEVKSLFFPINGKRGVPRHESSGVLAMRIFRPPLQARVELAGTAPCRITFNGMRADVKQASGPWQSSGEWWSKSSEWKRQEWDIGLVSDGRAAVYRIFQDCFSGQWFVEAMYD
jgi:protein ImuB